MAKRVQPKSYPARKIALRDIVYTPSPVRRENHEHVKALAQSMGEIGLIIPIVVRDRDGPGYDIVAGRHRYKAAEMLGWTEIWCTMLGAVDDDTAMLVTLEENLIRASLSPAERMALEQAREKVKARP